MTFCVVTSHEQTQVQESISDFDVQMHRIMEKYDYIDMLKDNVKTSAVSPALGLPARQSLEEMGTKHFVTLYLKVST